MTRLRCPRLLVATGAIAVFGGGVGIATAASPIATTAASPRHVTVTLKDIGFHHANVRVRPGGSVKFFWNDGGVQHNVISQGSHTFKSSRTRATGTYTVKFTKKGTYRYVCTIHFGMKGSVVVG